MSVHKVLINGEWREADASGVFQAVNPSTTETIAEDYPVSRFSDVEAALKAGQEAADALQHMSRTIIADFLDRYADRVDARKDELSAMANAETALPVAPRLADVELPRTTNQMRLGAKAIREGSWSHPTIDTASNIRSVFQPLGGTPIVFGPNNFPFAFNGIAGGDFVAAIAAGNPVLAKANTSHPGTTRLLAEEALAAIQDTGAPKALVQLIYRTSHADGETMVSHPLTAATGYTGARAPGLTLKAAADAAGKPIYLELSSINPVYILPQAIAERGDALAEEFQGSCLMGTGQFCTNPGIVVLLKDDNTEAFIGKIKENFENAPVGTLLGPRVEEGLCTAITHLQDTGATLVTGGEKGGGQGCCYQNTLLRTSGTIFLSDPEGMQEEAFGNASLIVVADSESELLEIARQFEGNLTGCIYSDTTGKDDELYNLVAPILRHKVGRLLNDKMPTGVAVVPSMNHGGPYPATGHPGFTAVGIPASLLRFAQLCSYDNVRQHRLPAILQDVNPGGSAWRLIDGAYTQGDVG
jgi:2,5-dioxopentanoate dehydrogenase